MTTTGEIKSELELVQGELSDLKSEVAGLTAKMEIMLAIVKWGGTGAVMMMLTQTIAIVALAGYSISARAGADGFSVGTTTSQTTTVHSPQEK